MGILWALSRRSFLLEKAFICYFRHQHHHTRNTLLNPRLAALFLWHSRINLDCESIWGPACGYEFSREFIYLFFPRPSDKFKTGMFPRYPFFCVTRLFFSPTLWFCIYVEISCPLCFEQLSKKNCKAFSGLCSKPSG